MRPLRVLFSYHFYREADVGQLIEEDLRDLNPDVFADSGAFSAWSLGKTITVDEYVAWLRRWGHCFTCAAALDVIGDAQASFDQTLELRKKLGPVPYPIIPVVHSNDQGGALKWLDAYLKEGFDYIGVSPTGAIYGNPALMQSWLQLMFDARPEHVRYHGFGVTGWKPLTSFPWYSVDSTSWLAGFRYANLSLFDPERGYPVKMHLRDGKAMLANAKLLRRYGLSPHEVRADRYRHHRDKIVAASVASWRAIEDYLNRKFDNRVYLGTSAGDNDSADGAPRTVARSVRTYLGVSGIGISSSRAIGAALRGEKA